MRLSFFAVPALACVGRWRTHLSRNLSFVKDIPSLPMSKAQPLPLSKIKVLDLTSGGSGPFCSMILADLGADICKVEALPHGDSSRQIGPFEQGESVYFQSINRNKRSLALNFASKEGREILERLVGKVDVMLENYPPGALENRGLSEALLKRCNPHLVHASITGYGLKGPYSQWPWADITAQGYSGIMRLHHPTQGQPLPINLPIANLAAGMWSAIGVLAALLQKRTRYGRNKRHRKVEVSLLGSLLGMLNLESHPNAHSHSLDQLLPDNHLQYYPYGVFHTKNGQISLAVLNPHQWTKLCQVLGVPKLGTHKHYATNLLRIQNRCALQKRLETLLKKKTLAHWVRIFNAHDVPAGQIYNAQEMLQDNHILESGLLEHTKLNSAGIYRNLAHPIRISGIATLGVRLLPPTLGQHSLELLWEAGFSKHQVQRLANDGVILDGIVSTE